MKKLKTALAVSTLLVSALIFCGCGPNRNDGDMADNQQENNNAVDTPDTAGDSETAQNGTIVSDNNTAQDSTIAGGNSTAQEDAVTSGNDTSGGDIANAADGTPNGAANTNGTAN